MSHVPMLKLDNKEQTTTRTDSEIHPYHEEHPEIALDGRVLLKRTAFVGHSFDDSDRKIVEFFKAVLNEMGIRCSTGERAEATTVGEKIKKRISDAELFVGIFTRREKLDGKNEWRTPGWLIDEKAFAEANNKRLILLKEDGVVDIGGLQGDLEYVPFDRNSLHDAVIKLLQIIWSLNQGTIVLSSNKPPQISLDFLEHAVSASPREPRMRLMLAQQKITNGQIDGAMRELDEVLNEYPDFGPALHEQIKGLRTLGRKKEAETIVRRLLVANPSDAMGHHQLAHLLEDMADVDNACAEYEQAENCNPGDASHYRCHGMLLFRTAGMSQNKLRRARDVITTAIDLGGEKMDKVMSGHLVAIKRILSKLARDKKRQAAAKTKRKSAAKAKRKPSKNRPR